MFILLNLFCALSFLGFGLTCLFSDRMRREFERYGIPQFRVLTGILQLSAFAGLLVGFALPLAGLAASIGLTAQMALGLGVRIRIRDTFWQSSPALFYLVLSARLAFLYFERG